MHLDMLVSRLCHLAGTDAGVGRKRGGVRTESDGSMDVSTCVNRTVSGGVNDNVFNRNTALIDDKEMCVVPVGKDTKSLPSNSSNRISSSVCSARVRVEALRTLKECTTQLHHKHTHIHTDAVLKALRTVLKDRKRVVRLAAAETVQSWVMLQP